MDNEFSVYQFFPGGEYEEVLRRVDVETAVKQAKRLTESVGGRLGTTERVIITNGGDLTVFEWKHGVGVTFPPECARGSAGMSRPLTLGEQLRELFLRRAAFPNDTPRIERLVTAVADSGDTRRLPAEDADFITELWEHLHRHERP